MVNASELERYMLELVNAERVSRGMNALQLEQNLNLSAEEHSQWMLESNVFSHTGQGGSSATARMLDAGFDLSGSWRTAENLAIQSERGEAGWRDDVADLHTSLMNSPGHRANILNPNLVYIGIGIEGGDFNYPGGGTYDSVAVTQNFAATQGDVDLDTAPVADPDPVVPPADPDPVVPPADPDPVTPPADPGNGDQPSGNDAFVAQILRLYRATLDREPDPEGLRDWVEQLASGAQTLEDIAASFVSSDEFTSNYGTADNAAFVTLLYNNVLDRTPDDAGLDSWVDQLASGALSRAEIVVGFSESPEFQAATQIASLDISEEIVQAEWADDVFRLYQATLGRAPDVTGLLGWIEALADGGDYLDIVGGFVGSTEFNDTYGATSSTDFVTLLYQNVLERTPDSAGLSGWSAALETGDLTRAQVVEGFAQSAEFIENSAADLISFMRGIGQSETLTGGGANKILIGGLGADTFQFAPDHDGAHTIVDLEAWDYLDLRDFGYSDFSDAASKLSQSGDDVQFSDQGVDIALNDTALAQITPDMVLV